MALKTTGMTRKSRRLVLISSALGVLAVAAALVLFALRDTIVFFYTPSDIETKQVTPGTRLRLGGLVKEGSVVRTEGKSVVFSVRDAGGEVRVSYTGLLPDLFREGQGIVAEGVLESKGQFRADSVLAKHDETYMPRDLAESLKKQGLWQHGQPPASEAGGKESAMIVETGHYALILALALAVVQAIIPLVGSLSRDVTLMRVAPPVAVMQFIMVAIAYGALTWAYVTSDFSLVNVFENSHSLKPLVYKISGVWGNHEGSMLLWVLILVLFGALVALSARNMPDELAASVLAVQAWVSGAFLLFILLTSNPFARVPLPPIEGRDLNPILQDPGLAIHPPMLYLGYVGFSMTFSFAAAALINGRIDAVWARYVRPWALLAWLFLTLGIAMGSYWAYYTLGWGGFWFWDPVENASLMPWLAGTALLHCTVVMEKRDALKIWTIFLAILAFSLSLLGTFLVRSGVLTSVHAFASDPQRGIVILGILVFFIGGSLALFAFRAPLLKQGGLFAPVSREGALVLNNLLLTTACATVFVGTLYPLALEALTGAKISVGPPFFNYTFIPLFVPLFFAIPVGQLLAWKRGDLLGAAQRLVLVALAGAIAALIFFAVQGGPAISAAMSGLAIFVILGSFFDIGSRIANGSSVSAMLSRGLGLPRSAWGTALAHAGVGVTLLGLAATGWGVEKIAAMKIGDQLDLGHWQVTLDRVEPRPGPNYRETVAHMTIRSGGNVVAQIEPSRRFFTSRRMTTSQAGLLNVSLGQIYVVISDQETEGPLDTRLYWKPFVSLIWLGPLIMAIGGAISLTDRRMRLGVAQRARRRREPEAKAVAAE